MERYDEHREHIYEVVERDMERRKSLPGFARTDRHDSGRPLRFAKACIGRPGGCPGGGAPM